MIEPNLEKKDGVTPTPDAGNPAPSQKAEDKGGKVERTEKEKAEFSLKMNAKRLRELGGNPDDIIGTRPNVVNTDLPDETPVTVGVLRDIQRSDAHKTALQLADEIEDEAERNAVKDILTNKIKPSGNAEADLSFARTAANAKRTTELAEEQGRKGRPTRTAAGGSQPARVEEPFEPTAEERVFMAPPYNVSKDKILASRKAKEAQQS